MNITQLYEDIQSFIFRIWSKTFFEGFDLRDSLLIQSVVTVGAQLFRTGNSEEKIPFREAMSIKKFIRMVTSRSEKPIWEERQGEPVVHQDQKLAVVWVTFRFYLDQKVLHCGYNLFTLFWNGNTWLITQVSDTRAMNCTVDHSCFHSLINKLRNTS